MREVDTMAKAQTHAQAEISPAVAMLVVVVVLSMALGMLLYSLEHNSVGISVTGSGIRERALKTASRGDAAKTRAEHRAEHFGGSAAAPRR